MIKRYFLFLILAVIAGCVTNPPDPQSTLFTTGRVFVNSNIAGAEIYVDDLPQGKFTPDTLIVRSGTRVISLVKEGYLRKDTSVIVLESSLLQIHLDLQVSSVNKLVVLEDFANVSCDPCVVSNQIIHSLDSYTYKDKIAVIKFPTYWPGPTDPLYLAAKIFCDARINYYRIMVAPTVIVDGQNKPTASDSTKIKQAIDLQLSKQPKFNIEVTKSFNGNDISAAVSVALIDTAGLSFSDLVLHTIAVESIVEFTTPPGNNGETKFYHVMRLMMPSADGQSLMNHDHSYSSLASCNPSWDKSKLRVIAFIQNKTTKEILQAGISL